MPKKPKTEPKPAIDEQALKNLLHEEIGKEAISYNNRERLVKRLVPRIVALMEA